MLRPATTASIVLALIVSVACKRDGDSKIEASGELSSSEKSLFAHLPGDANLVFGGSFEGIIEHWDDSPLSELADAAVDAETEDQMREYMTCFLEEDDAQSTMAGSLTIGGMDATMSMIFGDLSPDVITRCAEKSGFFDYHRDDDGKYIEYSGIPDGMGGTSSVGYYFVDESTAFSSFDFGMLGSSAEYVSRAELENRLEQAASDSAADSSRLAAVVEQADRSRAFWFAGSFEGTMAAEAIESGHGWFDMDSDSLSLGFTAELASASMASETVEQYDELSGLVGMLPAETRGLVESILDESSLKSSGKTLNGHFVIKNDAVEKALPSLKEMMAADPF